MARAAHAKPCMDCGGARKKGSKRCDQCAAEEKRRVKHEANLRRSQDRPGYIPQAVRCANADKDRSKEYARRLAKRLGMKVEQYLEAKAELAGKKLASHPAAVARREISKAETQVRYAKVNAARAQKRQERERLKAEALALYPWRARSLSEAERWHMRYRMDPAFRIKENLRAALKKKRMGRTSNWGYCLRRAMVQGRSAPSIEA
ncbi:hypothetical protein [Mesorhizobium sp. M0088]|uniref:hypothetical protein n=1 Tax=Mesorhizobium sp. M0088 TaxID=2956873 RepID=UPI00333CBAD4